MEIQGNQGPSWTLFVRRFFAIPRPLARIRRSAQSKSSHFSLLRVKNERESHVSTRQNRKGFKKNLES
jgi:hypothetical protein